MSKFFKLNDVNGDPIYIRADKIVWCEYIYDEESEETTCDIWLEGDADSFSVSVSKFREKIQPWLDAQVIGLITQPSPDPPHDYSIIGSMR